MINKLIIYKFFLSRTFLDYLIIAYDGSNCFVTGRLFASVALYADQVFEYDRRELTVPVDGVKCCS